MGWNWARLLRAYLRYVNVVFIWIALYLEPRGHLVCLTVLGALLTNLSLFTGDILSVPITRNAFFMVLLFCISIIYTIYFSYQLWSGNILNKTMIA